MLAAQQSAWDGPMVFCTLSSLLPLIYLCFYAQTQFAFLIIAALFFLSGAFIGPRVVQISKSTVRSVLNIEKQKLRKISYFIVCVWLLQVFVFLYFHYSPQLTDVAKRLRPMTQSSVSAADKKFSQPEHNTEMKTISVVLPCANEGHFAWKTAKSFGENTDPAALHEIVVVDDGSIPALQTIFPEEVLKKYPIKFVRHEKFTGLINAKLQGGNNATGDIITFFDCHVRPRPGWEKPFIRLISENNRRIVVPSITTLNITSWNEDNPHDQGFAKCYLTLDGQFAWIGETGRDNDEIPIMSGGLLGLSRHWWLQSGGYDPLMLGWGGENIDQSLRAWLCGGEVIHAKEAKVAHMWREKNKAETFAKYRIPENSATINIYRAMMAWADEWNEKMKLYPMYRFAADQEKNLTDSLKTIFAVRDRLKCRNFAYFIHRFQNYYIQGGIIPASVHRFRHVRSGLCMHAAYDPGVISAVPCSQVDQYQWWHLGNRRLDGRCCSGYRLWNTKQCMTASYNHDGGKVETQDCSIVSERDDQWIDFEMDPHSGSADIGVLRTARNSRFCMTVQRDPQKVIYADCSPDGHHGLFNQAFELRALGDNNFLVVEFSSNHCLGPLKRGQKELGIINCNHQDQTQQFSLVKLSDPNSAHLKNSAGQCVEITIAEKGNRDVVLTDCSDTSEKQMFMVDEHVLTNPAKNQIVLRTPTKQCLSLSRSENSPKAIEAEVAIPPKLSICVHEDAQNTKPKIGQSWQLSKIADYENSYYVKDAARDLCLASEGFDHLMVLKCPSNPMDARFRWSQFNHRKLRNDQSSKCLDANNHVDPILYHCYDQRNTNQEWDWEKGNLLNDGTQLCLDYLPIQNQQVVLQTCQANSDKSAAQWEIMNRFEPSEMKNYRAAQEKYPWMNE